MGRARNPDRERAKKIWLRAEPGMIKLADIAAKLKYSESTIRRWKCEDKWEEQREALKKSAPKKRGAQPGNRNGVGHGAPKGNQNAAGHGAPKGNQNGFIHGGYSKIFFDSLDDTEKELINALPQDEEQLLIEEIQLLTARERRIMRRINYYSEKSVYTESAIKSEERRTFADENEEREYEKRIREKVEAGERLPGKAYRLQTVSEASYSIVLKLEEALTRCQSQKQRAIDSLFKVRAARKSGNADIEDMYLIRKVVFGSDDGDNDA